MDGLLLTAVLPLAAFALLTHFLLWLPPTIVGALCFVSLRGSPGAARPGVATAVERAPEPT